MGGIQLKEGEQLTKFHTHVKPYLEQVLEWLKAGMTEGSICKKLGICQESWIDYKKKYLELSELYTRAQEERCGLVMNSMFRKSLGEKVTVNKQKSTRDGEILDLIEEQYIPPDVNAADLFLRNNDPQYKSSKDASSSNTFIQNNVNVKALEANLKEYFNELKNLAGTDIKGFLE